MATIFERVKKIVIEQLGVTEEDITLNSSFAGDLKADSLDLVELIMAFEEEFGLEISDQEAEKIITIQNAINYIESHGTKN